MNPGSSEVGGRVRRLIRDQTQRQHFGYHFRRYQSSKLWWLVTLPFVRVFRANLLPQFPKHNRSPRLLEIGCAHGGRLAYLRDLGWEVEGVEFSELAASKTRERGINCAAGLIEDCNFDIASYDAIIMSMVLEHIADPLGALKKISAWLKPDGLLLISVPNFHGFEARVFGPNAYTVQAPTHLTHFTPKTLNHMLSLAGLKICDLTYQTFHRDLKVGLELTTKKYPRIKKLVKMIPDVTYRLGGWILGLSRTSSRMSLTATLRKNCRWQ